MAIKNLAQSRTPRPDLFNLRKATTVIGTLEGSNSLIYKAHSITGTLEYSLVILYSFSFTFTYTEEHHLKNTPEITPSE